MRCSLIIVGLALAAAVVAGPGCETRKRSVSQQDPYSLPGSSQQQRTRGLYDTPRDADRPTVAPY